MAKTKAQKRHPPHSVVAHFEQARQLDQHDRYARAAATIGQETYVDKVTGPGIPEGASATLIVDYRTGTIVEVRLSIPEAVDTKPKGKTKAAAEPAPPVVPEPEKSDAERQELGDGGQSQGGEGRDQTGGQRESAAGEAEQADRDADGEVRENDAPEVKDSAEKPNPFAKK